MEDVLEQLVGEIWDETDVVEEDIEESAEGAYEIDGDTPVSDLLELMHWNVADFDYESETVGGWCIEMMDGFPEPGQAFAYENAVVKVLETEEHRVRRVRIKKSRVKE